MKINTNLTQNESHMLKQYYKKWSQLETHYGKNKQGTKIKNSIPIFTK